MAVKKDGVAALLKRARRMRNNWATEELKRLLVDSLSDQQRAVYESLYMVDPTTSKDVADELGIKHNHACNVLIRLLDLGLVRREATSNEDGLHYHWFRELDPVRFSD